MYKPHQNLTLPPDKVTIWRYMDLPKYLSLISSSSLFFSRADLLQDSFEGSSSEPETNYNLKKLNIKESEKKWFIEAHKELDNQRKKESYINCWHINNKESFVMWGTYVKSDNGVAIKSSVQRLKSSFSEHSEDDIMLGMIEYKNYNKEHFSGKLWGTIMTKRDLFEDEKELRGFIWKPARVIKGKKVLTKQSHPAGINISVDLNILIDEVIVSPKTQPWLFDSLNKTTKALGINCKFSKSQI